ncbi:family 16 glycosylhydrolase [Croceivirga sp. JEA036]|uniref:family 16 glycosylhydrolase n=1 Tax=Croceivirga sp. JEA036 TaxID=2721162 RepID=UPI0014393840|nr:family 16 glycosylhydrolase [Croceivirga sp. JEA036]NJB37401.1 family 16 glycosylhydrolase [Croceivirga sp. JEA036]
MIHYKNGITAAFLLLGIVAYGQKGPFFTAGEDPKPSGAKWKLVKGMSDEFNGKKVDEKKWQISGQGWIGRAPGLFVADNITVADGNLEIITNTLDKPVVKQGKTYTHGGGYVGSYQGKTYGYYECRMKANKTFMSSTFWLINDRRAADGCDKRTTELDIQECVGEVTTNQEWAQLMLNNMNSNTHSRDIPEGCDIASGTIGAKQPLQEKATEDYHVYGVWWKSKDEVLYFLDGKFHAKVKPAADFNIPMHLRMVVETYDWNPVPADGGMTGTAKDRTTYYDWVRTWELKE